MLDRETGEVVEKTLKQRSDTVREFRAALPAPLVVGLVVLQVLDELEITYRVGHPATIRKAEPRKQKHDRRDAVSLLQARVAAARQLGIRLWIMLRDQFSDDEFCRLSPRRQS